MKKISKLLAILILICSLFIFTACDPSPFYFEHEYLADTVSIELIRYDNPEQKHFLSWVPDHTADLKSFDQSKVTVLETLHENKIPDFIDTLCEYDILYKYYAFDTPNGICIKLNDSNGDFLIVSCNENSFAGYIGKFYSNGEVADFIGCFSALKYFETLVNDHFQMKI
ncbi:MAG: hypothetical protein HFK10_03415 [Clostridia bacterium]|nr:hypothetical protein [Clostridia bacterium]